MRCLLALALLVALPSVAFGGGPDERLKDHPNLLANIEKAKVLTGTFTEVIGALTEEEKRCICNLLGEDASAHGATGTPKIVAGVCLPDTTAAAVRLRITETPTETHSKPQVMTVNNKLFGAGEMPANHPHYEGVLNVHVWLLAEVLAHEKDHWAYPNNHWKPQGGVAGNNLPVGGNRIVVSHREHRAYCRSLLVMEAAKKYYTAKAAAQELPDGALNIILELEIDRRIAVIKKSTSPAQRNAPSSFVSTIPAETMMIRPLGT